MSTAVAPAPTSRGGGLPYKYQVIIVVIFGAFISILDTDIVNVALPKLQAVFGVDLNAVQWVVNGYILALTASVPFFGWLADRVGTKTTFIIALSGFTGASCLCGLAWNNTALVTFRIVQGLVGGALLPLAITLIFAVFPPEERGVATALLGVPILFAPALGPTLGGYFVDKLDWRLNFLVNVPIGVVGIILAFIILRESETKPNIRLDIPGLIFASTGFVSIAYGTTKAESDGWDATSTRAFLLLGVLALAVLVVLELNIAEPLLEFKLLRNRGFASGLIVGSLLQACLFGALFLMPLFLQNVRGQTAYQAGLILLPSALVTIVVLPIAGRLVDRIGAKPMVVAGLSVLVLSSYLLAHVTSSTPFGLMQLWLSLRSVSLAMCIQPVQVSSFATVPPALLPRATAFNNVFQRAATSIGTTYLTTNLGTQQKIHFAHLAERVTALSPFGIQIYNAVQGAAFTGNDTVTAEVRAIQQVTSQLQAQATVLAYQDTFFIVAGIAAFSALVAIFVLPQAHGGGGMVIE